MTVYRLDSTAPARDQLPALLETDPSWTSSAEPSFAHDVLINGDDLNALFFDRLEIGYVTKYALARNQPLLVLTHPKKTKTCYEKAEMLGRFSPLRVIKTLYLQGNDTGSLYGVVIPETGCFLDRARLADLLGLDERLDKSRD